MVPCIELCYAWRDVQIFSSGQGSFLLINLHTLYWRSVVLLPFCVWSITLLCIERILNKLVEMFTLALWCVTGFDLKLLYQKGFFFKVTIWCLLCLVCKLLYAWRNVIYVLEVTLIQPASSRSFHSWSTAAIYPFAVTALREVTKVFQKMPFFYLLNHSVCFYLLTGLYSPHNLIWYKCISEVTDGIIEQSVIICNNTDIENNSLLLNNKSWHMFWIISIKAEYTQTGTRTAVQTHCKVITAELRKLSVFLISYSINWLLLQ